MKSKIVDKTDARYIQNNKRIRKVLLLALADRSLNLRANEICKKAIITRPTLHNHCNNATDALEQYEEDLRLDFISRLPSHSRRKMVFYTRMLGFISDEAEYFRATIPSSNFYLLNGFFQELKSRLGYSHTTRKHYEIYTQQQIALICCWVKYEDFAEKRIPFYVDKLSETEIVDLGLE